MRFGEGWIDGSKENGDGRERDDRDPEVRPAVRGLLSEVQVSRALGQRIAAEEGARHVPEAKDGLVPSHEACEGLGERAHSVGHHPQAPPKQMWPGPFLRESFEEDDGEKRGAEGGEDGQVQDGLVQR